MSARRPLGVEGKFELHPDVVRALAHAVQARIGCERDQDDYLQCALDWLSQPDVAVTFAVPSEYRPVDKACAACGCKHWGHADLCDRCAGLRLP